MKSFSNAYQERLLHEKRWIMINGIFRKWPDSYIMKTTHSGKKKRRGRKEENDTEKLRRGRRGKEQEGSGEVS